MIQLFCMRKLIVFLMTAALIAPSVASAASFDPNFVVADRDMTNKNGMSLEGIQSFMSDKGALGSLEIEDLDGKVKRASDIVYRVANEFLINPKFILVMLQKEQSLVTASNPTQKQLDWATGYAVCDSCSMSDSGVARFQGFAKQIDSMAQQYRLGYLVDLEENGRTQTGIAPGEMRLIDGIEVVPVNDATAAMYTYTPHIEGNRNFWTIWNNWFSAPDYPSGTLLRNIQDNTVWLIKFGKRKNIESEAVLASFYNPNNVIEVDEATILNYEESDPIKFPNYSLIRVQNGDVYLIVNDKKRRFVSMAEFLKFGYQEDEIVDATIEELEYYENGSSISYRTEYPQGVILQHPDTGMLYYVDNGTRHAIVSDDIKAAKFANWRVRSSTIEDLAGYIEGPAITFPDGTLMMVPGNPTVYVVSDGKRLPIIDEATFLGLGYQWDRIIDTTPAAVEVHLPGNMLSL